MRGREKNVMDEELLLYQTLLLFLLALCCCLMYSLFPCSCYHRLSTKSIVVAFACFSCMGCFALFLLLLWLLLLSALNRCYCSPAGRKRRRTHPSKDQQADR